ncbi:MAG: hypothetical protein EXX96DRAFT_474933 [Benjaminiella poitrasii]|nr:MAG: hypothetical protein EXX96DRAFT_474933 [Benjaminiella poitrasii]
MSELAPPVLPDHVKKPNEEEHKKNLEKINANIERIQKQFDAVRAKIAKLPQKNENTRREEIKTELAEIRDKQAELKKTRKAVYDQLDAINESIRKKVGSIKGFQSKIPFKTTEEVDARIAELERKIEAGMLQEITLLKRNRLSVEDVDEQQNAINREREISNELKKNIDSSEAKKLSDRYEELDAEIKELSIEQNKQYEIRKELYDERTRLKEQLDEEYNKLRTTRDEHRKNNDEYYTFVRKLREYKREQEQLRKQQEEIEKRQQALKQELELAALPAFESEIALCDNLAIFLEGFLVSDSNKSGAESGAASPNVADNAFEGMVIKKRDEENFFVGKPSKKKQQKNKDAKEKKDDSLKIPLATMEAFFDIKVTVPTKVSEIPATLKKLKERKAYYIAEQPKTTELNKKKAEERIAAIQKEEEERKKAEAEAKEAAAKEDQQEEKKEE